jgi:hypothetical protein
VADLIKLEVPDLGDFADVEVIEVLVKPGDSVEVEDGLSRGWRHRFDRRCRCEHRGE